MGRHYGEPDDPMSWLCSVAVTKVDRTLTEVQRAGVVKLRKFDGYTNAEALI